MTERHIVIVGGGFTGTAVAIHLARLGDAGLTVTVVEPRAQLAQGVAYGTRDPSHRINVPADRMQLSAAEQGDFDRWFRASPAYQADADARWQDGKVYPQRGQFGAYIAEQFARAQQHSAVRLHHLCDRAVALEQGVVTTALGKKLAADEVVLAISHPPPALPRTVALALEGHPGLIADPWRQDALAGIASDERVAIMGSGLSMSDVVATLQRHGHRGPVLAFSRRGLLPRPNLSGEFDPRPLDYQQPQPSGVRAWLRRIRKEVALAAEQQLPWQLVLDDIRLNGQRIWQQLSLNEQRRFLRHLRPWWDVHRYRIAPQVSAVLEQWQQSGQLSVNAARLAAVNARGAEIELLLQSRGAVPQNLTVDRLIITTGPAHGGLLQSDALLHQLASAGIIQSDPLALGILVNGHSQTLRQDGRANPHLYVAGPAARAYFGELMGLPQVAEHAESVARQLLGRDAERCPG
ncbi:FAD/NAD(P)-binding protein [Erwinia sorbitola]|uniref:FAD-dependent oxidoreductase n=1 Tax=Erwinia sorbitola TaxID=2681984 RepID=A0ABW9R7A4_9GAMM|nr:FAD-dependent oxidoreductase [Erwinia sorbitola]MTD25975.1 FAD-dependent oxidoreductase [Erwinia sorbitola]